MLILLYFFLMLIFLNFHNLLEFFFFMFFHLFDYKLMKLWIFVPFGRGTVCDGAAGKRLGDFSSLFEQFLILALVLFDIFLIELMIFLDPIKHLLMLHFLNLLLPSFLFLRLYIEVLLVLDFHLLCFPLWQNRLTHALPLHNLLQIAFYLLSARLPP